MKNKLPSSSAIRYPSFAAVLTALALFLAAPTATAQTNWGMALSFDGVDDYVQAPAIPLANASFTIEAWARRDTSDTMDMIVAQGTGTAGNSLMFGFHWFGFDFDFYGDGVSSTNIDNAWHHWAGTYNASNKVRCLYRDGVLLATNVAAQNYQGSGPLYIGREPFDDPACFAGVIDDLSIWSVARDQAEIQSDMSRPLAGIEPGLVAYYRFDEGTGTTAYDATTNHFDATLVNGPAWTVSQVGLRSLTQSDVFYPNVLTYSFSNARPPTGPGTLKVTTVADLDLNSEFLTLGAEGVLTSNLFVTGGQQMVEVSAVVNLTQSQLAALAADGMITFTLTPSLDVNNLGASWARLELAYPSASPGFVNGSFETGDFTGWITTDLTIPFSPLAVRTAGFSAWSAFFTSLPTDGTYAAVHGFDGNGPGTIQIAQDVVVPGSATLLTFDYRAAWDLVNFSQNPLPRVFRVVVQPAGGGAELAAFTNLIAPGGTITNDTGPITGTNDLTAFAGKNVRISFQAYVPQPSTGPAFFQLDHVRFLPNPYAVDHFAWATVGSPQVAGAPFPVTITARNQFDSVATNFSGTVALSGTVEGLATNSILGSPNHSGSGFVTDSYTIGYAFTPNANLTVTHVRHYFGSKVSIWTDGGALLAAQNVSSVPGTWVETPLASPIQLTNGVRYRVGVYFTNANYYYRDDMAGVFPHGTIDVSYQGSGDAFPTLDDGVYWWFVDLSYTAPETVAVAVSPSYSLNFVNGVWSGNLTVLELATNMVLLAADTANKAGHRGTSGPFNVISQAETLNHFSWSTISSPQVAGAPFPVTITARNQSDNVATWFSGSVALSAGVRFAASFDNGLDGFTFVPDPDGTSNLWHRTSHRYASPTNCLYYGKEDLWNYDTGTRNAGNLQSPVISLAAANAPVTLSFKYSLQTEGGTTWDQATVLISADGGGSWALLAGPLPNSPSFTTWTGDISAYAGSNIVLRFNFDTLDSALNDYEGWYVDDVVVSASTAVAINPTNTGNFVNGVWSGNLTVLQPVTNLVLAAADNTGHQGTSSPFNVISQAEVLDHFSWNTLSSPQVAGAPFPVTITARNPSDNVATWFSGTVALSAGVKFAARFDSGLDGFTFVPDPDATSNLWHRTSHRYASPTNCLYYGKEGTWNYDTGARNAGNAQSPPISLAGSTAPVTLSFKYSLETEGGTTWDQATVLISADGGGSWALLAGPLPNSPSFITWTGDISAYAGSNIILRFNFDTVDQIANAFEGWYVDDVVVNASTAVAINPANTGNFVNGVWSGNLTVPQPATNLILAAADNTGHLGTSNPFDVRPPPAVFTSCSVIAPGQFRLSGTGMAGLTYTLQTSTNLVDWVDYGNVVAGTNGLIDCVEDMDDNAPICFYRLKWP